MQNQQLISKLKVTFALATIISISPACADEVIKFTTHGAPAYFVNDQENPELSLKRGTTYQFEVNTPGHPLWIKTNESPGSDNAYASGLTGNGTDRGTITFVVPADAPAALFYNCQFHIVMHGKINITD